MRKVYTVLFLFFSLISTNFGQIVNESFEGVDYPPSGWDFNNDANQHKINGSPYSWDLAYHGVYRVQFNGTGDWLQSKPIKNPDVLTFWISTSTDTGNVADSLHWRLILQTSSDGISFTDQDTIIENGEGGYITSGYTEVTVNLNLTGTYVIRWYMDKRNDDWAFFDYVNVTQQSGTSNVADHLVISEIYSRGGYNDLYDEVSNSNGKGISTYNSDYVVLYNPTSSSVDLAGWSVQVFNNQDYPDDTFEITSLTGSISPNSYYLIQFHTGSTGSDLPNTPHIVNNSVNLHYGWGKIALVNNQDDIIIDGANDANVIDFVGYTGSDYYNQFLDEWEGFNSARYTYSIGSGNTYSIRRKDDNGNNTYGTNGSGYNINDNKSDFYVAMDLVTEPPLPVELTSFTVTTIDIGAMLVWTTATEVNNYGFEIQRASAPFNTSSSVESKEWETIGFVEGHGNSYSPKDYSYIDSSNLSGDVNYRLKQIDTNGDFEYSDVVTISLSVTSVSSVNNNKYELYQNHPNPFNPSTKISYSLSEHSQVNVTIYNMLGQKVIELVNQQMEVGYHDVSFDGSSLSSGLYLYRLETPNYSKTMKMMLLK